MKSRNRDMARPSRIERVRQDTREMLLTPLAPQWEFLALNSVYPAAALVSGGRSGM